MGPAPDRSAAVYGGTGHFVDASGSARTSLRVERFDKTRGLEAALGRLHLDFELPAASDDLGQAAVQ